MVQCYTHRGVIVTQAYHLRIGGVMYASGLPIDRIAVYGP